MQNEVKEQLITSSYEGYQLKVIEERKLLEQELFKLNRFLKTVQYDRSITSDELYCLENQKKAMKEYADALTNRICNFK